MTDATTTPARRAVVRTGLGVAVATGAYGISFGAVAVAAGLSPAQACVLSLLMFTGGSQFAFAGVVAAGGSPWAGVGPAALLGARNLLYAVRLRSLLPPRGWRRLVAAQLVIDESTAVAVAQDSPPLGRLAFWVTGAGVYLLWNAFTLAGALGATALGDPRRYGLDAAGPAAFLALLAPRLRGRQPVLVALTAAAVALAASPFTPPGVPVLLAALTAFVGLTDGPAGSVPVSPPTGRPT